MKGALEIHEQEVRARDAMELLLQVRLPCVPRSRGGVDQCPTVGRSTRPGLPKSRILYVIGKAYSGKKAGMGMRR